MRAGCDVARAAGARHACRDDTGRSEPALRRPHPVRSHPRAPLARRARAISARSVRPRSPRSRAGRMAEPIPVEVDEMLLDGVGSRGVRRPGRPARGDRDGQLHSKNLVIGLGGALTINRSHFLGAVCDMETIMGRPLGPVRDVVDAAFDRFLSPPDPGALGAHRDAGHGRGRRAPRALRRPRRLRRVRRRRLSRRPPTSPAAATSRSWPNPLSA